MQIIISGDIGSGKGTVSKMLAEYFKYPRVSTGDLFREMAKERNMSLIELLQLADEDRKIHQDLDDKVLDILKEKNNLILDARLGAYLAPNAFKVYLKVDEVVGARRILDRDRYSSIEQAVEQNKKRQEIARQTFIKMYNFDFQNLRNYNIIIDTSYKQEGDVVMEIIDNFTSYKLGL